MEQQPLESLFLGVQVMISNQLGREIFRTIGLLKIKFTTIMTMWQPQQCQFCCSIVVGALSACMILDKMVCMMVGIVINMVVGVMFGEIVGLLVGIVVWAFACLHDGWRPYKELIACLVTPTFDCFSFLFFSLMRSSTSKHRKNCECCPVSQLIVS